MATAKTSTLVTPIEDLRREKRLVCCPVCQQQGATQMELQAVEKHDLFTRFTLALDTFASPSLYPLRYSPLRNFYNDFVHYCSHCGLRLKTVTPDNLQPCITDWNGVAQVDEQGRIVSSRSVHDSAVGKDDDVGFGKPESSAFVLSPFGPPALDVPNDQQPKTQPHASCFIIESASDGTSAVARSDAPLYPIYTVQSKRRFIDEDSAQNSGNIDQESQSPDVSVIRVATGELIGIANIERFKAEMLINGRALTLKTPHGWPGTFRNEQSWASTQGTLVWQKGIQGQPELADLYRRLCATSDTVGDSASGGSLFIYGHFDEALVDEIIVSFFTYYECDRRRGNDSKKRAVS